MGSERGSFSSWLLRQSGRSDQVGFLARRYAAGVADGRFRSRYETAKQFSRAVVDRVAPLPWNGSRDAFRRAKQEFEQRLS